LNFTFFGSWRGDPPGGIRLNFTLFGSWRSPRGENLSDLLFLPADVPHYGDAVAAGPRLIALREPLMLEAG